MFLVVGDVTRCLQTQRDVAKLFVYIVCYYSNKICVSTTWSGQPPWKLEITWIVVCFKFEINSYCYNVMHDNGILFKFETIQFISASLPFFLHDRMIKKKILTITVPVKRDEDSSNYFCYFPKRATDVV